MTRQIVLDTETTGFDPILGHRIIEIGCVEMIERRITGNYYHVYINPQREIEDSAIKVHGITNEFLQDKPIFSDIVEAFVDFVKGSEVIAHNASFDVGFINAEFKRISDALVLEEMCPITDTLKIAREKHVGQRNSLDALCKRYGVDNSNRDLHGALLDAELLAFVYLALTGGQGGLFEGAPHAQEDALYKAIALEHPSLQFASLASVSVDAEHEKAHQQYCETMKEKGACLWGDE